MSGRPAFQIGIKRIPFLITVHPTTEKIMRDSARSRGVSAGVMLEQILESINKLDPSFLTEFVPAPPKATSDSTAKATIAEVKAARAKAKEREAKIDEYLASWGGLYPNIKSPGLRARVIFNDAGDVTGMRNGI